MLNAEKALMIRTKIMVTAARERVGFSLVTKVHAAIVDEGVKSADDAAVSKKENNLQIATQSNVKTAKGVKI